MKHIVTLTMNPSIDTSTRVGQVDPDRKLRCEPPRSEPGGGGINVSRAIEWLGGTSVALYPAGGPAGEFLQSLFDEEEITYRSLAVDGWTRENFVVSESNTEQQFRFSLPGPELGEAEWQRFLDELARLEPRPDYVVASGSLPSGVPEDFYARVARTASGLGARLVVDSSGEALRRAAQEGVYLIKPNVHELGSWSARNSKTGSGRWRRPAA